MRDEPNHGPAVRSRLNRHAGIGPLPTNDRRFYLATQLISAMCSDDLADSSE